MHVSDSGKGFNCDKVRKTSVGIDLFQENESSNKMWPFYRQIKWFNSFFLAPITSN